mgnify:FL=1|jgi:hypothetical protein|nr:MAG TPA: hypothetical protein [Caudoviricetes sp.]
MYIKAKSKFRIGTVIRKILIDNEDVKQLVGDKIFPLVAPQSTEGDLIVYYRDEYSKDYTKMGVYNDNCKVYVTIVSDSYDRSQEIAEAVNNALEGTFFQNTDNQIQVRLSDSTEDYADNKYIQVLLFEIQ